MARLVGNPAPHFKADALVNGENKTISLDDYKGKWKVLFFYPLDFTFVCPTEIIAYSDIVLLVPSHKIGLECVSKLESKNINVIHVFAKDKQAQKSRKLAFFMGDARVKACTIHSFKGWESSYLVVAITEKSDLAATYVALSRLKRHKGGSHLTVISSSNTLREFGQTWTFVDKQ
jgi:hypothetical protein